MRPSTWRPKNETTLWLDLATGQGQVRDGISIRLTPGGRRKNLALQDVLSHAAYHGFTRVMLLSEPKRTGRDSWFSKPGPGWETETVSSEEPPAGTYRNTETDTVVAVRCLAEWFGDVELNIPQARATWDELEKIMKGLDPEAGLLNTPAATGKHFWALSVPRDADIPLLPADILEEIHANAGQHYKAHLVAGPSFPDHPDCIPLIDPKKTPEIANFAEIDGRVMYASLLRDIGAGPAIRAKADTCEQILADPRMRFTPARYLVRFTVPDHWSHIGLLGVKDPDSPTNWLHPNRPGATHITWADNVEIDLARQMQWEVEPLEGIILHKGRWLDRFSDRLNRALEQVGTNKDYDPRLRKSLHNAIRSIILHTIGSFASRGRSRMIEVTNPADIPPEYRHTQGRTDDGWKYEVPPERSEYQQGFYHPEFAAQIWAKSRVKVMNTTSALSDPRDNHQPRAGALWVKPSELIGIQGDALYLGAEQTPMWARPVSQQGGDDGRIGRLRVKTALRGPLPTPIDVSARTVLHERAAKQGWRAP